MTSEKKKGEGEGERERREREYISLHEGNGQRKLAYIDGKGRVKEC